jgi:hypothetical protein
MGFSVHTGDDRSEEQDDRRNFKERAQRNGRRGGRDEASRQELRFDGPAQHYNIKLFEFSRINSEAAFDYAEEVFGVRYPPEFNRI